MHDEEAHQQLNRLLTITTTDKDVIRVGKVTIHTTTTDEGQSRQGEAHGAADTRHRPALPPVHRIQTTAPRRLP